MTVVMRALSALTLASFMVPTSLASAASPADDTVPPPRDPIVVIVTASDGDGCAPSGVKAWYDRQQNVIGMGNDDMYAEYGPTAKPGWATRSCTATVQVTPPSGYTFAIDHAAAEGTAYLAQGVTGLHHVTYGFLTGNTTPVTLSSGTLHGPYGSPYSFAYQHDAAHLNFAPCGAPTPLQVNTTLTLGGAQAATDSIMLKDTEARHIYSPQFTLAWKKCDTP